LGSLAQELLQDGVTSVLESGIEHAAAFGKLIAVRLLGS